MFNKLQYISQGETIEKQLYNIHEALDAGCDWIQMRFKNQNSEKRFVLAEAVKILCKEYSSIFIINDDVLLAQKIAADGVHLGLGDMSIPEARAILGDRKIIGATANTFEDVLYQSQNGCDYIGLGPFQFTETKEKLSPVLGAEGYVSILNKMRTEDILTPVYAIGGITLENIEYLLKTGIYGIAVSGIITKSLQKEKLVQQLNDKLYANAII
ncbi:thiamine phosphate synthase [Flavobacterium sp.]|uniref:thiamine phosphate synthase n=1 Tax=Flavobacterium sp. TaxID=239 RepID=UPI00326361E3